MHYELPKYYSTQVLAEMAAMGVQRCIYCSWGRESLTMLEIQFDEELWNAIMQLSVEFYGNGIEITTLLTT